MVDDLTPGVYATSAWTRVYAFQIRTCCVSRTVGVRYALRPAGGVGVAEVSGDARAGGAEGGPSRQHTAVAVGSAGTGVTGVHGGLRLRRGDLRDLVTLSEWIALIFWRALADSQVVSHGALSIEATGPGARVYTLVLGAGLLPLTFIVDHTLWFAVWRGSYVAAGT